MLTCVPRPLWVGWTDNFDGWARSGCTGWSYDEVLPYFKKLENCQYEPLTPPPHPVAVPHGTKAMTQAMGLRTSTRGAHAVAGCRALTCGA